MLQYKQCQDPSTSPFNNLLYVSIDVPSHLIWHHRLHVSHCIAKNEEPKDLSKVSGIPKDWNKSH